MAGASPVLDCADVRRALAEALGPEGLPEEARRHLGACEACGREAAEVTHLARALRAFVVPAPPAAFWETLPRQVAARVSRKEGGHPWLLSALTAAALLLLTVGPTDREPIPPGTGVRWLAEVAVTDPGADPLAAVRSAEEAARVVQHVALAESMGPRVLQSMMEVVEEQSVRRAGTLAWDLLTPLSPSELERVVAHVQRGVSQ